MTTIRIKDLPIANVAKTLEIPVSDPLLTGKEGKININDITSMVDVKNINGGEWENPIENETRIQITRGNKDSMPTSVLDSELRYAKDTNELFISTEEGNKLVSSNKVINDTIDYSKPYPITVTGTNTIFTMPFDGQVVFNAKTPASGRITISLNEKEVSSVATIAGTSVVIAISANASLGQSVRVNVTDSTLSFSELYCYPKKYFEEVLELNPGLIPTERNINRESFDRILPNVTFICPEGGVIEGRLVNNSNTTSSYAAIVINGREIATTTYRPDVVDLPSGVWFSDSCSLSVNAGDVVELKGINGGDSTNSTVFFYKYKTNYTPTVPLIARYPIYVSDKSLAPTYYTIYSDGWVEQQGLGVGSGDSAGREIPLSVKMANTNYFLMMNSKSHTDTTSALTTHRLYNDASQTTTSIKVLSSNAGGGLTGFSSDKFYWEVKGYGDEDAIKAFVPSFKY